MWSNQIPRFDLWQLLQALCSKVSFCTQKRAAEKAKILIRIVPIWNKVWRSQGIVNFHIRFERMSFSFQRFFQRETTHRHAHHDGLHLDSAKNFSPTCPSPTVCEALIPVRVPQTLRIMSWDAVAAAKLQTRLVWHSYKLFMFTLGSNIKWGKESKTLFRNSTKKKAFSQNNNLPSEESCDLVDVLSLAVSSLKWIS